MLNLLKQGANTLVQAANEVAEELAANSRKGQSKSKNIEEEGELIVLGARNIIISGFPDRSALQDEEVVRRDRSLRPFTSPDKLKHSILEISENFLVWNLSGKKYSYEELDGKIIEYDFPSRPILPFQVLVEVATAVNEWIKTEGNIAVIHDISGRRSAVIAACALEMSGAYSKDISALKTVQKAMGRCGNALVASQVRYFDYFCQFRIAHEAFKPQLEMRLQRIIVNGVPDFSLESKLAENPGLSSCCPYLKIIDGKGQEVDSTVGKAQIVYGREESFSIIPTHIVVLSGDIMLRFFHKREPPMNDLAMFALSFHVGFVNDIVLRFTLSDIDGTSKNPRFPKDMFVDLIFTDPSAPVSFEEVKDSATTREQKIEEEDIDLQSLTETNEDIVAKQSSKIDEKSTRDPVTPPKHIAVNETKQKIQPKSPLKGADLQANFNKEQQPLSPIVVIETPASKLKPNVVSLSTPSVLASPSAIGDSVLNEIEAALGEDEFAMEDFEISELDDLKADDDN